MTSKQLFSPLLFICFFVFISMPTSATENPTKPFVVVLDPGHGGKDPGNRGNGFYEKDIVLDVSLQVGRILEAHKDIKVVYTRKTDVFIDLYKRGPIANEVDADIFVSIHCDSHHSQAQGIGTFVMGVDKTGRNLETAKKENEVIYLEENYEEKYLGFDPNSPESLIGMSIMLEEYLDQSIMLAGLIQSNIVNNLKRKDRSVRSAPFWVLHSSYMPSVLVELGFLTNNSEGPYVNSKKGRSEMAREIANGIIAYKNQVSLATEEFRNPVITEEKKDKALETTVEDIYDGVTFKVQLAASGKKIDPKPSNFKGLKEVERDKEDGLFKYYYGSTSDYNQIQVMRTFAQQKGYPSAYIVAYKNGKRVNLSQVLKSKAN